MWLRRATAGDSSTDNQAHRVVRDVDYAQLEVSPSPAMPVSISTPYHMLGCALCRDNTDRKLLLAPVWCRRGRPTEAFRCMQQPIEPLSMCVWAAKAALPISPLQEAGMLRAGGRCGALSLRARFPLECAGASLPRSRDLLSLLAALCHQLGSSHELSQRASISPRCHSCPHSSMVGARPSSPMCRVCTRAYTNVARSTRDRSPPRA